MKIWGFLLGLLLPLIANSKIYWQSEKKSHSHEIQIAKDENEINIHFSFDRLETSENKSNEFEKIQTELNLTLTASQARLPYKSILVEGEAKNINIEVISDKPMTFKELKPEAAVPMPCRCKDDERKEINLSLYKEGHEKLYEIVDLGDFRGKKIAKINLYPSQFNYDEGYKFYPEISFRIQNDSGLKEFVLPESFEKKMLVVGPVTFKESMQEFISWKRQSGFDVSELWLSKRLLETEGIKEKIKESYKENEFSYAVLVGHENNFPTFYRKTSAHPRTPSDMNYFLLGSEDDQIPDVFYSRIAADNNEDVKKQTAKIMDHEKNRFGKEGLNNIAIASNEGYAPSDREYVVQMSSPMEDYYESTSTYFHQDDKVSVASEVNKIFNQGALWVHYIGHGSGYSWLSLFNFSEYDTNHIPGIVNDVRKPIIVDVSCQNGRFSLDNRLSERFMNEQHGGTGIGAVAYYGGSVDISWHPPAIMAVGISKAIESDKYKTIGPALLAGQLYLLQNHDSEEEALENLVWYHLLGDSSLYLLND